MIINWNIFLQRKIPKGGVVIPIILYSDSTELDDVQRAKGHPLILTLGNMSPVSQHHEQGHALLGYFPELKEKKELNGPTLRRRKRQVLQQCLDIVLGPLREAGNR